MYIELRCTGCGESAPVLFKTLLDIWKQSYDSLREEDRGRAEVVAVITCHCGCISKYNSPMFKYIFRLMFDEIVLNKGT